MSVTESIPDRIRRLREQASMTQAELADESGISRPSMNEIETGITAKPRRSTLAKIAKALGVETDYLQTGGKAADVKANTPASTGMQVVEETEMEKQLKQENKTLREQLELLRDLLRTGGDLSKLGGSFSEGDQDAVETYTHQRIVVAGLVRYQMQMVA